LPYFFFLSKGKTADIKAAEEIKFIKAAENIKFIKAVEKIKFPHNCILVMDMGYYKAHCF
jgi:hypothetical protein